jgi:hypothetical protein
VPKAKEGSYLAAEKWPLVPPSAGAFVCCVLSHLGPKLSAAKISPCFPSSLPGPQRLRRGREAVRAVEKSRAPAKGRPGGRI